MTTRSELSEHAPTANRLSRWFAPCCFVLLFGGVGVASAVTSPAEVDNRDATELRAPDVDGLFGGEWFDDTNDALSDRLVIRDQAIEANAEVDYRLFRDSTNPRVLVGSDGWLFLADTFTSSCAADGEGTVPNPDDVVRSLDALAAVLGPDTDLVVAAVPEKAYLHPEFLPDVVPDRECGTDLYRGLVDRLSRDTRFLDLESELQAMRQVDPDAPLYRTLDTHWNPLTRAEMVRVLVERWDAEVWDPHAVAPLEPTRIRGGDLAGLLGYWPGEEITRALVLRLDVTTTVVSDETILEWVTTPNSSTGVIEGKTVIITDSHFYGMSAMLAPWFENLVVVRENYLFDEGVTEPARGADRVFISYTGRSAATAILRTADRLRVELAS